MIRILRSLWIWFASATLILLWTALLTIVRLFDRDPQCRRTGRWFRLMFRMTQHQRLGVRGILAASSFLPVRACSAGLRGRIGQAKLFAL
ncbi:hypothetical protein SBA3_2270010 [Candidatus Sulfopaludibacter sp. SbA3]|nr:hypothetical protein SBA3_2270010 [Candidatus Sulfopaludibacter sp. SbA3]